MDGMWKQKVLNVCIKVRPSQHLGEQRNKSFPFTCSSFANAQSFIFPLENCLAPADRLRTFAVKKHLEFRETQGVYQFL